MATITDWPLYPWILQAESTLIDNVLRIRITKGGSINRSTVDSAYNIQSYKGQPAIVATKIISQNPH